MYTQKILIKYISFLPCFTVFCQFGCTDSGRWWIGNCFCNLRVSGLIHSKEWFDCRIWIGSVLRLALKECIWECFRCIVICYWQNTGSNVSFRMSLCDVFVIPLAGCSDRIQVLKLYMKCNDWPPCTCELCRRNGSAWLFSLFHWLPLSIYPSFFFL